MGYMARSIFSCREMMGKKPIWDKKQEKINKDVAEYWKRKIMI